MLQITVCMIVRNEDNHIAECIKRLRPCRFRIVVVDTGSIDRTEEMARKYTDKVYEYRWCSNFSDARNFAVSKAETDWVLTVDSDEYLEQANLLEMEDIVVKHPQGIGMITRDNPYSMNSSQMTMKQQIGRLFNRKIYRYEGAVHEQLVRIDGGEPESFDIPLTFYHVGYVAEPEKRARATRNLEMLLDGLKKDGPDVYRYYQLGQNYVAMNDTDKAAEYYRKGLEMNPDPNVCPFLQDMVESYGFCLISQQRYGEAEVLLDRYELFAVRADYIYLAGLIYEGMGKYENALREFNRAAATEAFSREGVNSYRAYYEIGQIYEKQGNADKAENYYIKCGNYDAAVRKLLQREMVAGMKV
jgi:glycosyltransferase involved in cell wall biosynthesis